MTTLMAASNPQGMMFGLTTPTKPSSSAAAAPKVTGGASSPSQQPPAYKVPKFLRSLYSILQNEDAAIVKWVQNQELKPNRVTAFHILDLERFENEVLPKYFKHSKFASFQRQLNNFGFRKWTKTQSSGVCTFSHNSFPPDPREIGVLRASIREQWRQKTDDTRRRVGNGITKAERKLQQQVQQQVQLLQAKASSPSTSSSPAPSTKDADTSSEMGSPSRVESFSAMLKMPLTAGLENAFPRAPTHQPQVKKLARGEWVAGSSSGLEAFAEHGHATGKHALLPPLQTAQPHHLPHVSYNNTVNLGTYPPNHHHPEVSIYASVPHPSMKMDMAPPPSMVIPSTQLEPWAWTPHTAPAAYFPVDTSHAWPVHHDAAAVHKGGVYCHAPDQQASPSTMEEFTFDHLLLFTE